MTSPDAGLAPLKAAGVGEINKQYQSLPDQIQAGLSSRGMGRSGQNTQLQTQAELGRAGAIGGFEGQWANLVSQRQLQAASLSDQLLAIARGISTTGSQSGTQFGGGLSAGGTVGGGLSSITFGGAR